MKNTTKPILAVFGGAFNPPHQGHLNCVKSLLMSDSIDHVLVVPSAAHPFGKKMLPMKHRMAMLKALFSVWHASDQSDLTLSDLEANMKKNLPKEGDQSVYSYDVLKEVQKAYPNHRVVLAVGEDNVEQLPKFYKATEIEKEFGVLAIKEHENCAHSTVIREKVKENRNQWEKDVGASVAKYIKEHGLYSKKTSEVKV
jgi:nicotinate-nucleotide adenylyltransferase